MNKTLFLFVIICLLFASCKKKIIPPNQTTEPIKNSKASIPLIHTHTYYEGKQFEVDTFYYDEHNRITKINKNSGKSWKADYSTPNVFIANYYKNNVFDFSVKYTLNNKGYFITKGNIEDSACYDENGFLLHNKNEKLTILNGNITERIIEEFKYKIEFEFDLTKLNTIGSHNSGWYIEGNDNKNLVISEKIKIEEEVYETKYKYEFDKLNRVIKRITVCYKDGVKSEDDDIETYTYY